MVSSRDVKVGAFVLAGLAAIGAVIFLIGDEREIFKSKLPFNTQFEDVQGLRDVGWTDPQIAEAVYITAMFAFFNRVADAFGLDDPNYFGAHPDWWPKPPGEVDA